MLSETRDTESGIEFLFLESREDETDNRLISSDGKLKKGERRMYQLRFVLTTCLPWCGTGIRKKIRNQFETDVPNSFKHQFQLNSFN
jgi:hypothetical protein